jgi:hypothetical protein
VDQPVRVVTFFRIHSQVDFVEADTGPKVDRLITIDYQPAPETHPGNPESKSVACSLIDRMLPPTNATVFSPIGPFHNLPTHMRSTPAQRASGRRRKPGTTPANAGQIPLSCASL